MEGWWRGSPTALALVGLPLQQRSGQQHAYDVMEGGAKCWKEKSSGVSEHSAIVVSGRGWKHGLPEGHKATAPTLWSRASGALQGSQGIDQSSDGDCNSPHLFDTPSWQLAAATVLRPLR